MPKGTYCTLYYRSKLKSEIMKKLKLLAVAVIGIALVSIVSCKKGDTGPAGPAGPAGPDSVMHSAWIPLNLSLVGTTSNGDSVYQQTITASAITQKILDSGVVLTYFANGDGSIVDVSDYSTFLDIAYSLGTITVTSYGIDITGYEVRYVVIPGSILVSNSILKSYTKEQLKSVDYVTISKALGLSDSKSSN